MAKPKATLSLPDPCVNLDGPTLPPVIQTLNKALQGRNAGFRVRAIDWLQLYFTRFSRDSSTNFMRLLTSKSVENATKDKHPDVRAKANALWPLFVSPEEAFERLNSAATDPDAGVRKAARESLLQIDWRQIPSASASEMVEALIRAAANSDPVLREAALQSLPHVGQDQAPPVLSALVTATSDDTPAVRKAAIEALRKIPLDAASAAVPALIKALKDPVAEVRGAAVSSLAQLGPEAVAAVLALLWVLLEEQDDATRDAAVRALSKIDPGFVLTLPRLRAFQGESSREAVLRYLRRVGPETRSLRRELQICWVMDRSGDPNNELPQPDGPGDPNYFWWKGKRYKAPGMVWDLLVCLWGKESVSLETVRKEVWKNKEGSPGAITSAINRLTAILKTANVPWRYGEEEKSIVRKDWSHS